MGSDWLIITSRRVKRSQKSYVPPTRVPGEKLVRDIPRATREHHSAESKIRIVLGGLRGEGGITALCHREANAESLHYAWSKEFLEAGRCCLAGDTARAVTSDKLNALRQEARALKEVVAERVLELGLVKKNDRGCGRLCMRYPYTQSLLAALPVADPARRSPMRITDDIELPSPIGAPDFMRHHRNTHNN
jgi:transposase